VDNCVANRNVSLHNVRVVTSTLFIAYTLNDDLHFAVLNVNFQGSGACQGSGQLLFILQLGCEEGARGHDVVLEDLQAAGEGAQRCVAAAAAAVVEEAEQQQQDSCRRDSIAHD
jgi:hypothetical protein